MVVAPWRAWSPLGILTRGPGWHEATACSSGQRIFCPSRPGEPTNCAESWRGAVFRTPPADRPPIPLVSAVPLTAVCTESSWLSTFCGAHRQVGLHSACSTHSIGYNHCKCPATVVGRDAMQDADSCFVAKLLRRVAKRRGAKSRL